MSGKNIEDIINEVLNDEADKHQTSVSEGGIPKIPVDVDTIGVPQGENFDGTVAVKNGQIVVKNPTEVSRYPSITPDKGVIIKVNGKEINGSVLLTEETVWEVCLVDEEPSSSFDISLSKDELEAFLTVKARSGKKFFLEDQNEANHLVLTVKLIKEIAPPPITVEEVTERLNSLGIKYGLDMPAVERELKEPTGQKVVIARGQPPVPPQDVRIEYLFNMEERNQKQVSENERVNYLDRGKFQAAEVGTVLAVKRPAVTGKSGTTVTGKEMQVGEPKDIEISVGDGVTLMSQGQKAVASAMGRPVLVGTNKTIKILSELTISGNVDIHTGHIEFKGDVIIHGNVTEGLIVRAGGRVTVKGHVYSGHIMAEGDVSIGQNLVGGTVTAGGEGAFFSRSLPVFIQLQNNLQKLLAAIKHLKDNPLFCTEDLHIKGDGNLVKLLIDMKFKEIPKMIETLNNYIKTIYYQINPRVQECIELMTGKLTGLGPLKIMSLDELTEIEKIVGEIIRIGQEALGSMASVTVKYAQNASIEATGSIFITGPGSYHTNIFAGRAVTITGICRGGFIRAVKEIAVSELGSTTSVATKVETNESGKIRAGRVYPNVYITVGRQTIKTDNQMHGVLCSWNDGTGLTINKQ